MTAHAPSVQMFDSSDKLDKEDREDDRIVDIQYNQIDKPKDSLYDGATPLDIAKERGHQDVVKYLKKYYNDIV